MTSPVSAHPRRRRPTGAPALALAAALLLAILAPAGTALAQGTTGALFPEPFVVEHHLVQTDDDGSRFETEPVTDYYGGSWIVSVRPDGSRRIVDLARREVTEVQPDRGTYWSLSFDRLGALTARLADLATARTREARGEGDDANSTASSSAGSSVSSRAGGEIGAAGAEPSGPPDLVIQELPAAASARPGSRVAGARPGGAETEPASRPGVTHLRVVEEARADEADAGLEVWLDPSVRLRPAALDAVAAFEAAVLAPSARAGRGATQPGPAGARASASMVDGEPRAARPATAGEKLAAARAHAAGAVPVRTVRTLAGPRSGEPAGTLEDRVTRLERLEALPLELVEIPEGLRRVPHPAEALVPFMEDELELDRAMSGERVMFGQQVGRPVTGGGER